MDDRTPHGQLEHDYFREKGSKSVGTQSTDMAKSFEEYEYENKQLREEAFSLRSQLTHLSHQIDSFRDNDDKTVAYTPFARWSSLLSLHNRVENKISFGQVLSKFQILLIFLIRVKMNLPAAYLSSAFNVSEASVNRIFTYVLDLLYEDLKEYVSWQNIDGQKLSMQDRPDRNIVFVDFVTISVDTGTALVPASVPNAYSVRCMTISTADKLILYVSKFSSTKSPYSSYVTNNEIQTRLNAVDVFVSKFPILDERDGNTACGVYCVTEVEQQQKTVKVHDDSSELSQELLVCLNDVSGFLRKKCGILNSAVPNQYVTTSGCEMPVLDKIVVVCCGLNNFEKMATTRG